MSVSELQKVSRYSPGSLGGRSCEYPEDYQGYDDDSEDNREHPLHPLSGGFFLDLNRHRREGIKQHEL